MSTDLVLSEDQREFTGQQLATLQHLGVSTAAEGDLKVFFNQCIRTGLDPFVKQIYMIERQGKQTIQTAIDGYRLIARRSADKAGQPFGIGAPQWCTEEGQWRDVWLKKWGVPVAARVTVTRQGEPFVGIAMYDEYAQTKRDGGLTSMWATRGAGQLAKCAEALALRKAFPLDLSGIYVDAEMDQAANPEPVQQPQGQTAASRLQQPQQQEEPRGEDVPLPMASKEQVAEIQKEMARLGYKTAQARADAVAEIMGAPLAPTMMTADEADVLIQTLAAKVAGNADQ